MSVIVNMVLGVLQGFVLFVIYVNDLSGAISGDVCFYVDAYPMLAKSDSSDNFY